MRKLILALMVVMTTNVVNLDANAAACNTAGNPSLDQIGAMIAGNWTIKYGSGSFISEGIPLPFPIFADMGDQIIQIKQNGKQLYGIPPGANGVRMDIKWERRSFFDLSKIYVFSASGVDAFNLFAAQAIDQTKTGSRPLAPGGCPIQQPDSASGLEFGSPLPGVKLVGEIGYSIPGVMMMNMWMIVTAIDSNNMVGVLWILGAVPDGETGDHFEAWRSIHLVR